MRLARKIIWVLFAVSYLFIGLYPIMYFILDPKFGLLSSKSTELLSNSIWNAAFYSHIMLGGIALLVGWSQFSKKLRSKRLNTHRTLGKIYVVSALMSGVSGIYIGYFATGGIIAALGFISLGVIWVFTTYKAYTQIKSGNIIAHQRMMIYSYAACFAAVTLRIWLPILIPIFGSFIIAYKIVAWLAWVPNLIVANIMIAKNKV